MVVTTRYYIRVVRNGVYYTACRWMVEQHEKLLIGEKNIETFSQKVGKIYIERVAYICTYNDLYVCIVCGPRETSS